MCFIFSSSFSFLSFSGAWLLLRERQQFQDLQLTCFCVNWRTWNCCRFSYRNKNLDPSARHVIMIKFYAFYRKEMNMILTLLADGLRFLLRYDFLRASGSSSKTLDWRFFLSIEGLGTADDFRTAIKISTHQPYRSLWYNLMHFTGRNWTWNWPFWLMGRDFYCGPISYELASAVPSP